MSVKEKFEAKYTPEPNSGCWLWIGAIAASGYGTLSIGGRPAYAHRLSWQLYRGPIPSGYAICHKCDIRTCVNPDHLFPGTLTDNNRDMCRKGRHWSVVNRSSSLKGVEQAGAKLTDEDVLVIRRSGLSYRALGRQFGVSHTLIRHVVSRRNWKHVP